MRVLLAIALILLLQWLHKTRTSGGTSHENCCEAVPMSEAGVSLLLWPLSLYSWMASTLLRSVLSVPALVLSCLHYSLLLLLALPWCVATVCISLLLTWLHVALYLLHFALVVGAVAILAFTQHTMADSDTPKERVPHQQKKLEERQTKPRLQMFGRRVVQQGSVLL